MPRLALARQVGGCLPGSCHAAVPSPATATAAPQGDMQPLCRALAVVGAVVLLLVIVAADDPTGAPDTTPPADSLVPEPVSHGKAEVLGDSELITLREQLSRGVTRGGAERSLTDDTHPGALEGDSASLDALNSGAFNLDPLPGDAQSGPAGDVPAQSNESQESVDHDTDSEEALASPGM